MSTEKSVGGGISQEKVLAAAGDGIRCAECFVHVLREDGVAVPGPVEEIAPFLEWGVGGSGAACGVFVAAALASALLDEGAVSKEERKSPAPANEWLDAFTPQMAGVYKQENAVAVA